ncbi:MAG: hypothetical protein QOI82_3458 [Actinomycetota bacterium]|jgi:hypothetical protein|nr:hypothetical protein [Actinomycetota bacterium]
MSPYDVTSDDEPLDVQAVSEDDVLVEQLRRALSPDAAVVWDDDDDDMDPAFALLRALQLDVSADMPTETILPAGVTELLPRSRRLGRAATVAVVAASVLSMAGVAAASAPGQPLAGVRHAVSDAVSHAVDAITPDAPVGPTADATQSPSPKPTPPGEAVSTAARSASAVLQIEANLDRAAVLIDNGKYQAAKNQLDAATNKLHYVTDATVKAGLQSRLTALQARLAAMPTAKPTHGPAVDKGKPADKGNGGSSSDHGQGPVATHKPTAVPSRGARSSGSTHVTDDATPDVVESPSSHGGGNN